MGKRVATPCTVPGCPNVSVGHGRCAEHEAQRQADYDRNRPSSTQRGYDAEWRVIRDEYLAHNPACAMCGKSAVDVHHVVPLSEGGTNDWSNLRALCHGHHSAITRKASSKRKMR